MWGIVAGIVGASVALAVLETSLRSIGGGPDKPEKPGALPEPDKNFKKAPGKPSGRLGEREAKVPRRGLASL